MRDHERFTLTLGVVLALFLATTILASATSVAYVSQQYSRTR